MASRHQLYLLSISEKEIPAESISHLEAFCEGIEVFKISPLGCKMSALRGFFDSDPFQVHYFYRSSIAKKLSREIQRIDPDVVYCQLPRMANYLDAISKPKVLDFMDAFSLSSRRRANQEKGLAKWFYNKESIKLEQFESNLAEKFDAHTIISDQDKQHLLKIEPALKDSIYVISNGLDTEYFSSSDMEKKTDLVFVGNMGYHPNILAAKYLIREILPRLDQNIKITIAGTRPTAEVRALASEHVEITGWIEDIRSAYDGAKIFVAPIFTGAGQQNKILEAMAMGLPVVTTPIVNKGIGAESGRELLVAENEVEFAEKIKVLIKDVDLRHKIIVESRKFVEENYSWEKENEKLENVFETVLKVKGK